MLAVLTQVDALPGLAVHLTAQAADHLLQQGAEQADLLLVSTAVRGAPLSRRRC